MVDRKNFYIILLFLKFFILINYIPNLESSRYIFFMNECTSFKSCVNPYENITSLSNSYLTFPYSSLMYFILIPFYFVGSFLGVSFVNLTYLFFEVILIYFITKTFNVSSNSLLLILIFNPFVIYSIGILGQLDFIPLTFFIISIYFLKINKKNKSIFFLVIAFSTKIIFIVFLPIILLYFVKLEPTYRKIPNTFLFTTLISGLFNLQLILDKNYFDTVFYGIRRGYNVVDNSSNIFDNGVIPVLLFLSFTFFLFWKNIHRLDFVGVLIFSGLTTLPLYFFNLSNIGWLLWSYPALFIIFLQYNLQIKSFMFLFFSLLVITNPENTFLVLNQNLVEVLRIFVYFLILLVFYYLIKILINNTYFKLKSKPISIAITGDSAVGKTTLTNFLNQYFGNNFVDNIVLDSFHKHERDSDMWKRNTHLNPEMNNLEEFKNTVFKLFEGQTEIVKNYNHLTGKFDSSTKKKIKNFLIIEGLHSLYFHDLNKKYDLKVYLDLGEEIKNKTKISRDIERGKTQENIFKEIEQRKNDYIEFIAPQANFADLYINTLSRDKDSLIFEVFFNNDYFAEFEHLIKEINSCTLLNKNLKPGLVNFEISIDKIDATIFFEVLTSQLINLQTGNFTKLDINISENNEIIIKTALILYMLNKKMLYRL